MSTAISRPVNSRQTRPHPLLRRLLERRGQQPFRRPIQPRSKETFELLEHWLGQRQQPLILDAGCGTGSSSIALARQHPDHSVIGIDKSAHRLDRHQPDTPVPGNCYLARADLADIWRLAVMADWRPVRHYLLYPNPWPKPKHLARRWHAHPVLPWILALGGTLELRTNWRLYAEEFAYALSLLLERPVPHQPLTTGSPLTPFERKYAASRHSLWLCRLTLTTAERNQWLLATSQPAIHNQLVAIKLAANSNAGRIVAL